MLQTLTNRLAAEIAAGDSLRLQDIARQFDLAPSTCLRWVIIGLPDGSGRRIRLEAIRRGRPWLTSRSALERFLSRLPQSDPGIRTFGDASHRRDELNATTGAE